MNNAILERIPPAVVELARILAREGERCWVVGGCIRDLLLGRTVNDWDLATTARPETVQRIFPRTIPTGIAHGTITVMHRGIGYELTTLRGEGAYSDGRRPDSVFYVDEIRDDLERRDFTVNAIAFDPIRGELDDPFEGRADLEAKLLRAVREPLLRFREDGLRILRGTRFVATLGMALEPATEAAIPLALDVLAKVSRERMRDEWLKTMKATRPSLAFEPMRRLGVLEVVVPSLAKSPPDAYELALSRMDRAKQADVRHALLFSALGVGEAAAERAAEALKSLRYSNAELRTVKALLTAAATPSRSTLSRVEARRALRAIGREMIPAFVEFVAACDEAEGEAWRASAEEERDAGMLFESRELALRGDEVGAHVGKGPVIKAALDFLMRFVDEDPARNTREQLEEELSRFVPAAK